MYTETKLTSTSNKLIKYENHQSLLHRNRPATNGTKSNDGATLFNCLSGEIKCLFIFITCGKTI